MSNIEIDILDVAQSFVRKEKRYPSLIDLVLLGVTRAMVRTQYGSLEGLKDAIIETCDSIFDLERNEYITLKNSSKRWVFTTAVTDSSVDKGFLKNIKAYCKHHNASLGIFVSQMKSRNGWLIDPILRDEQIITTDVALNDNLFLLGIKNSAGKADPITGLPRVGKRNGTFICASPKQRLKYVATGVNKLPHALMSTGACTLPNYIQTETLINQKDYITDYDHVMGAIIVELDKNDTFHFRQIQADKHGSFCDLGKQWKNGKETSIIPILVPGDWHSGSTSPEVRKATINLSDKLKIKEWIMHDTFDGTSINHHEMQQHLTLAKKSEQGLLSLDDELAGYAKELAELSKKRKLTLVYSNHDDFLKRYLEAAHYVEHPRNHRTALALALSVLDGQNPLEYFCDSTFDTKNIVWLKLDESYKIGGVELGMHGHLGSNGSRGGSPANMEMSYGKVVYGHRHTAEILRDAYCVGTSTHLTLGYNKGSSSWTHTHCLVYPNGQRQLINFINGSFTNMLT